MVVFSKGEWVGGKEGGVQGGKFYEISNYDRSTHNEL